MITSQIQPDAFFSFAGCISNVEYSVGGNLELKQTIDEIIIILNRKKYVFG
jgi:hypothetical protein